MLKIFISRCRYSNCDKYWSRLGLPSGHSKTFEDLYKSSEMSVVTKSSTKQLRTSITTVSPSFPILLETTFSNFVNSLNGKLKKLSGLGTCLAVCLDGHQIY